MGNQVQPRSARGLAKFYAFKLPPETAAAFDRLAATRGKSPGLLAKELALLAIAQTASVSEPQETAAGIVDLLRLTRALSGAMAHSVHAILVTAGQTENQAARWIRRNWPDDGGERD